MGRLHIVKRYGHFLSTGESCKMMRRPKIKAPIPPMNPPSEAATLTAARNLMRPIVRLLLSQQIGLQHSAEIMKSLYVEVANAHFQHAGVEQSDSRISLLTGLHRREVKRLRADLAEPTAAMTARAMSVRLAGVWTGHKSFIDENGNPLPLPRRGAAAEGVASWDDLVDQLTRDLPARVLLDEMQRLQIVTIDSQARVRLNESGRTSHADLADRIEEIGRLGPDRIAVGVENLLGAAPPHLTRTFFGEHITVADVALIHQFIETEVLPMMRRANVVLTEAEAAHQNAPDATERVSFGMYLYHATMPQTSATNAAASTDEPAP